MDKSMPSIVVVLFSTCDKYNSVILWRRGKKRIDAASERDLQLLVSGSVPKSMLNVLPAIRLIHLDDSVLVVNAFKVVFKSNEESKLRWVLVVELNGGWAVDGWHRQEHLWAWLRPDALRGARCQFLVGPAKGR